MFPQLGPNPSYLDAQCLGCGESGCLMAGCILYLVNQSHPFTVEFVGNSNEKSSSPQKKEKKQQVKAEIDRKAQMLDQAPKGASRIIFLNPLKVSRSRLKELFRKIFKTMLH